MAVSGISLYGYSSNKSFNGGGIYHSSNDFSLNTNTVVLFVFVLVVAFAFSWLYFTMARAFTKQFIWITGILNILFGVGTAIFYFIEKYYSAAIVFVLFAIFSIICFVSWIPRIPFSVLMLQTCMDVAKTYGHVFLVSAIGGVVSVAYGGTPSHSVLYVDQWKLTIICSLVLADVSRNLCQIRAEQRRVEPGLFLRLLRGRLLIRQSHRLARLRHLRLILDYRMDQEHDLLDRRRRLRLVSPKLPS